MNIAVIFAGGTGQRMNAKTRPKQFLELNGKPILIHTIEQFEKHPLIDFSVVVCLESWIAELKRLISVFGITKVASIVPGGDSGQGSIYNGVAEALKKFPGHSTVLVHDGVRPLIDESTISACIECTEKNGNAIAVAPAIETIVQQDKGVITNITERKDCFMARAPQCFRLRELAEAHQAAVADGIPPFIDSASLMQHYGHTLHVVEGNLENIKITTPLDFYTFKAIISARENSQIFGY